MLGYVVPQGRGASDVLIREVAARLRDGGVRLAGAVQINVETGPDTKCMMDLHVLSGFDVVRISQNLGALSRGCRLDPDGLERAVGLVSASLRDGAALLIVNKFGKQEADGRRDGERSHRADGVRRQQPAAEHRDAAAAHDGKAHLQPG